MMLKLVSEKLKSFHLDLATDIVASTNDGAAVRKTFGQISPIINQHYYSHKLKTYILSCKCLFYPKKTETGLNRFYRKVEIGKPVF